MCPKQPRPDSIFCSNDCIAKHVERAKEFLDRNKPKQLLKKVQEVINKINQLNLSMICFPCSTFEIISFFHPRTKR